MCFTQTLGDIKCQDTKAWSSQRVQRLLGGRIPTLGDGGGYLWKHPCPRHALSPPLPALTQQKLTWGFGVPAPPKKGSDEGFGVSAQPRRGSDVGLGVPAHNQHPSCFTQLH